MNDQPITPGINFPALRAQQGSRTMYQIMVPNKVLAATFFNQVAESQDEKSQRQLVAKHAREIGEYINDNPDEYVLGSLTYAVDVECPFMPSQIHDKVGVVLIPLDATLRCLDGQHRRQGLIEALENDPELEKDSTAVVLYFEPEVTRRRQMFSDMNATPKVVAKALNVSFDTRDPFARVAQLIAKEHPLLKGSVETEGPRITAGSKNWYTLGAVFDALKRLQVGANGRVRVATQYDEASIKLRGEQFFDLLKNYREEFRLLQAGESADVMRTRNILLSSTTLRALAGAVHIRLTEDGDFADIDSYGAALAKIDFAPSAPMWIDCGFVALGKSTPNARNQEVLAATRAIANALKN